MPWSDLQRCTEEGLHNSGSLAWCRLAPHEVTLYCAACDTMKNIINFPRGPRTAGAQCYVDALRNMNLQILTPAALACIEAEMRGNVGDAMDWQCLDCRAIRDRQLQHTRRAAVLSQPCRACTLPLADAPPVVPYVSQNWIFNTRRRHPHGRKCLRCLTHMPPPWSVALRRACRDWRDLRQGGLAAKALHRVIEQLGCTTVYRCPWRGGLDRIALFLGTDSR